MLQRKRYQYKNKRKALLSLVPILAFSPLNTLQAEWVEFVNDASFTVQYNDNINVSAFSNDMETDISFNPKYSFGRFYQINDLTRLRLTTDFSASIFDEFNDLSSIDVAGTAMVQHKFGVGFNKPWIRGQISVGLKEATEAERDSDMFEVGVSVGKRITDRLSGQAGISYDKRDGANGRVVDPAIPTNVFDQENLNLSLGMEYLLNERSLVSGNLTYRDGEFDSACTVENVAKVLQSEDVKALIFDDIFGGCAYRVDGSSTALKLQYSYALDRHFSFNLGYEIRDGKAEVLDYDSALWIASIMYSR